MWQFVHRSLLVQLLSVYLLFVIVVLAGGMGVNVIVEQQLRNDAQASDQALAQEIALETNLQMRDTESALVALGKLVMQANTSEAIAKTFQAFQVARSDVDHVSWLDPVGVLHVSWPPDEEGLGAEFSPPDVIQRARTATGPVFEVGIAVETTFNAGVIVAEPVRTADGKLAGIVAASISLVELSEPLRTVVQAQQRQGRQLMISIIDGRGELIATPERARILQTVLDELPGADQALNGQVVSRLSRGSDKQDWLFSAVPVSDVGWAVVVQRPAREALAVDAQLHLWLLAAVSCSGSCYWAKLSVLSIHLRYNTRHSPTRSSQFQNMPPCSPHVPMKSATWLAHLYASNEMGWKSSANCERCLKRQMR